MELKWPHSKAYIRIIHTLVYVACNVHKPAVLLTFSGCCCCIQHTVYNPEHLLTSILAQIHYMPEHWKGNAHTLKVRNEFGQLFEYKFVSTWVANFWTTFNTGHDNLSCDKNLHEWCLHVLCVTQYPCLHILLKGCYAYSGGVGWGDVYEGLYTYSVALQNVSLLLLPPCMQTYLEGGSMSFYVYTYSFACQNVIASALFADLSL